MKGDLWDDSALLNAFDEAFLKQKRIHERREHRGNSEEEAGKPSSDTEELKPRSGALPTIEEAGESSSLVYYTHLMNQYYQIEEQRQKILNQLHHPHTTTSEVSHDVYSCCPAPPSHYRADDIPKTGIDAVNRALSLLKSSQDCDSSSSVKNNDKGSETDLSSVRNAWYLAGYHTGKYLEEQDQLKRGLQ